MYAERRNFVDLDGGAPYSGPAGLLLGVFRRRKGERTQRWLLTACACVLLIGVSGVASRAAPPPPPGAGEPYRRTAGALAVSAAPTLDIPIAESRNYYAAGLGVALSGTCLLHPPVHLRLGVAYGYTPLVTTGGMTRVSATLGVGVEDSLGGRFVLSGYGEAGYGVGLASYLGSVRSGGSLAWVLGTGAGFRASPSFMLGLAAGLRGIAGLHTGVSLGLAGA